MTTLMNKRLRPNDQPAFAVASNFEELAAAPTTLLQFFNEMIDDQDRWYLGCYGDHQELDMMDEASLQEWFSKGGTFGLLILAGSVIGAAALRYVYTGRQTQCTVKLFVIAKEFRRRGFGRLLLQHILTLAKQNHCHGVRLGVFANNTQAVKLYEAMKFKPTHITMYHTL